MQFVRVVKRNNIFWFLNLNEILLKIKRRYRQTKHKLSLINLFDFFHNIFFIVDYFENDIVTITRQIFSKNNFELLNDFRVFKLKIHNNVSIFIRIFNRIIENILFDLKWNNVIIVEKIIFIVLLYIDNIENFVKKIVRFDIDIYIHEFIAKKTNVKLKHIYNIWENNHAIVKIDFNLVIRTFKIIEYLAIYFFRRIQVILKLFANFFNILQNFNLNVYILYYNDANVLILSKYVKILKTNYNVFIINLIWEHIRRESRIHRVFKYVNREIEMRILSSYTRSLSINTKKSKLELKTLQRIRYRNRDFVFLI